MWKLSRNMIAVGLTLNLAMIAATSRADNTPPKGVVYVQTNVADAPGNQILAYSRDSAGKLTPIKGSPFSAGGAGISPSFALGPYDSDQEIITNPANTLLYATNGGSDTIAVFKFARDGGLIPVKGSPFPSGGSNPVGLTLAGDKMIVVNQDNDPGHPGRTLPSYTTLAVDDDGPLTPIKGASYSLDLGSSPSQAYMPYGSESIVFGDDFLGGVLRSFRLSGSGKLTLVDAQPLPAAEFALSGAPPLPLGLWSHPKAPVLYVGFVTINRLGVYRYNRQGQFEFVRTVPNVGKALCWIRSNKAGTRLYTSNTTDPSIAVYDISGDPTEPVQIQNLTLKGMSNAYQITLDPSEQFFYVVTQRNSADLPATANALHVLKISGDGTLTEVPSSPTPLPVPASSRPQGVLAF